MINKFAHILADVRFHGIVDFLKDWNSLMRLAECCNSSVKYFNFCWCEVAATSKQRLGLLGAILVSWWGLVCVTKVAR